MDRENQLSDIAASAFHEAGWDLFWEDSVHVKEHQLEYISEALTIAEASNYLIEHYHYCSDTVELRFRNKVCHRGRIFSVNGKECNCSDFTQRKRPCKHMYLWAFIRSDFLSLNIIGKNPVVDVFMESELSIRKIQVESKKKILCEQTTALKNIESVFQNLGQNEWTIEDHMEKGQYDRLCKAVEEDLDLEIRNLDYETKTAKFLRPAGLVYDVSLNRCTCADFDYRNRPCKHIYALAIALSETDPFKKAIYAEQITYEEPSSPASLPIDISTGEVLNVPSHSIGNSSLKDLTIVLTGTFDSYPREILEQKIRDAGGKVAGSVSRKTSYLVVGEHPGSKLEKAIEYGVTTINEQAILEMIGE